MTASSTRLVHDCYKPLPLRLVLPKAQEPPIASRTRSSQTKITALSNEILAMVYNAIDHPRDQVAFSLTCRRVAQAISSSQTDLALLKPGTLRPPGGGGRWRRYGKEHLLADLKRWGFIPENLQLCTGCWKYLPRNRIWRTRDGTRELRSLRRVDWAWAVMMWKDGAERRRKVRCPTCQIPEDYDDGVEEQFCQAWGEGLVERVMVVQKYPAMAVGEKSGMVLAEGKPR